MRLTLAWGTLPSVASVTIAAIVVACIVVGTILVGGSPCPLGLAVVQSAPRVAVVGKPVHLRAARHEKSLLVSGNVSTHYGAAPMRLDGRRRELLLPLPLRLQRLVGCHLLRRPASLTRVCLLHALRMRRALCTPYACPLCMCLH